VNPTCFFSSSKQPDQHVIHDSIEKMLPRMVKKQSQWCHQGRMFGLKQDLDRDISSKVNSLDAEIHNMLGDGLGANLAHKYQRASHRCYNDFINWTENFYFELQAITDVSESEAWNLILECWLAFFIDLLHAICISGSLLTLAGLDVSSER
jgi:hypothetical protein